MSELVGVEEGTREEFFEWLKSCPCKQNVLVDDYEETTVSFKYKETEEDA